jgi:ketosteroid isomerase-like protein
MTPPAPLHAEIASLVHRETRAWDEQDVETLVDLFHPDMVWPWPPTARDHDPATWVMAMGRYDRERWKRSWEDLFRTHRLVHNRRNIVKITVSDQGDAALAVVDIDTLWQDAEGKHNHWLGRVGKVYTRLPSGQWKLIMHTGALDYST